MIENIAYGLIIAFSLFVVLRIVRMMRKSVPRFRRVAVMRIDGIIKNGGGGTGDLRTFERTIEAIERMNPGAVIARVNSPGGTVGASQSMHDALVRLRMKGIKVIAVMEDVAASGGVYVSVAADLVIAQGGTVTGSIGVIMRGYNYGDLMGKLGVSSQTVKAGEYKDIMSGTRPMTVAEQQLLDLMMSDTHAQFKEAVRVGRSLTEEQVDAFADGRVLTGWQAKACGLVDEIGDMSAALRAAERLLGIDENAAHVTEMKLPKKPLALRLGLPIGGLAALDARAVELSLEGLPLWLKGH